MIDIFKMKWDYECIGAWLTDKKEILLLNLNNDKNINRFGTFYAKTLDYIATPIEKQGNKTQINECLFEI